MIYRSVFDRAGNEMTFVEVLELCKHSYNIQSNQSEIQIAGQTMQVRHHEFAGGFAAYYIVKPGSWTACVFRGSDDARDWAFNNVPGVVSPVRPPQYGSGSDFAKNFGKNAMLVGHSLGGGIATYAAAQHGMHAATIFPAPINPIWLALPLPPWPAKGTMIVNYVSSGEVLTMAGLAGKVPVPLGPTPRLRRYGEDVWIQSNGTNPIDKHELAKIRL